jgi:predicted PurR-regulated permease PerM
VTSWPEQLLSGPRIAVRHEIRISADCVFPAAAASRKIAMPAEASAVSPTPSRPKSSLALLALAWIAIVGVLYLGRDVLVPVALALLLTLLLRPVFSRLQKWGLPDVLSAFTAIAAVALLFAAGVFTLAGQGQRWLAEAPQVVERVRVLLPQKGPLGDLARTTSAFREITKTETTDEPLPVVMESSEAALSIVGAGGHFIGAAAIVFVLAFFLLAFSDTLLKQAVESRPSFAEKRTVVELVRCVESGISRYLATITLINCGLGAAIGLVVWLMGIPNPILWGVMAAVLNFVPHIGAMLCMAVLFLVGAVTHQSLWYGAATAAAFCLITSIESYFITPMVLSKSLQISPLLVILFILFWGWLWGVAGGLMAAPLLTVVKIICDQFPTLRTWSVLLGGEPRAGSAVAAQSAACCPSDSPSGLPAA